jgi:transposase
MSRRYGRARPGIQVHETGSKNFGCNVTIPGAVSCTGRNAAMTVDGATDTAVFRAPVDQVVVPTLVADDIVVRYNLRVHKVRGIRQSMEAVGARLAYLRPSSSDYSLIESCWSGPRQVYEKPKRVPAKPLMKPSE